MNVLVSQKISAVCQSFFGIDGWYKYIPKVGQCEPDFDRYGIGNIWLIIAGLIDMLIRIGILITIIFFILGAFKMVTSQGSPEGVKSA